MIAAKTLHRKWMKSLNYKAEHEALSEEFALISTCIDASPQPSECVIATAPSSYPKR